MRLRSILGAAATTAGLMAVALAPGAGAAEGATAATGRTVAAVAPSVSPSVGYFYVDGPGYTCPSGNFCARVWDPTQGRYKVFKFYNCATYSLSNWEGTGGYINRQTGSRATATLYGQSGNVLKNVPIAPQDGYQNNSYGWSPVYKIRNCY